MPLNLMYITNNPSIATIAERYGVNRIWIDLEVLGKEARQKNMDTVKSNHTVGDICRIKACLKIAQLMVRINPLHEESKQEIDKVIQLGAEIVMLPMFYNERDVRDFIGFVSGRAKTMLLVETAEAVQNLEKIVQIAGVDEIHIGLNDLHLAYGMSFMFELLSNGHIDRISKIIRSSGIPYGFGGISRLNAGTLPARHIIAEHYRLQSRYAILSRSFCDTRTDQNLERVRSAFESGIREIRAYEKMLQTVNASFFCANRIALCKNVEETVKAMQAKKENNLLG